MPSADAPQVCQNTHIPRQSHLLHPTSLSKHAHTQTTCYTQPLATQKHTHSHLLHTASLLKHAHTQTEPLATHSKSVKTRTYPDRATCYTQQVCQNTHIPRQSHLLHTASLSKHAHTQTEPLATRSKSVKTQTEPLATHQVCQNADRATCYTPSLSKRRQSHLLHTKSVKTCTYPDRATCYTQQVCQNTHIPRQSHLLHTASLSKHAHTQTEPLATRSKSVKTQTEPLATHQVCQNADRATCYTPSLSKRRQSHLLHTKSVKTCTYPDRATCYTPSLSKHAHTQTEPLATHSKSVKTRTYPDRATCYTPSLSKHAHTQTEPLATHSKSVKTCTYPDRLCPVGLAGQQYRYRVEVGYSRKCICTYVTTLTAKMGWGRTENGTRALLFSFLSLPPFLSLSPLCFSLSLSLHFSFLPPSPPPSLALLTGEACS